MKEYEQDAIRDRLEGWELVDFLQISIDLILEVALSNDWINEDNIEDLREYVGIK